MMKFLNCLFFLFPFFTKAQTFLNPGVDTSSIEVRSALKFYNSYLKDFKGRKIADMSKYWGAEELKSRKIPDQLIYGLGDYPVYSMSPIPTILYIKPSAEYIHFKTQFSSADSLGKIETMAITNHYVSFDKQQRPYFLSPLTLNSWSWQQKKIRNITFIYPSYHTFYRKKANQLISQIVNLEKEWGLKPIPIRYFFADTKDELDKLRGFDFTVGMGNVSKPSGISDSEDNQVFGGGLGENYFHEVVHVYLNRHYPKSPLKEGLAVLYGGSMGHDVRWHLKSLNNYLDKHPKVDLNNLDDFWYSDPYTNPGSAIQGMLCSLVYKKDGIEGLKKLMEYKNYNDIFEKVFQVKEGDWDAFLRKTIKQQISK